MGEGTGCIQGGFQVAATPFFQGLLSTFSHEFQESNGSPTQLKNILQKLQKQNWEKQEVTLQDWSMIEK